MIDNLGNSIAIGPTVRDRLVLPPHFSKAVIEISADILISVVVDTISGEKFQALDFSSFESFGYVALGSTGDNELAVTRKRRPLQESIQEFLPAVILGSPALVKSINEENWIATRR
jgi:hypothetical protein